jgi:glucokinase
MVAARLMPPPRVIGVDLGGTKILAGVVDRDGTIVRSVERPTPAGSEGEILGALEELIAEVWEEDVAAIGFGVPSTLDRGRVVGSVNIQLDDVDLAAEAGKRFGVPVGVDNDGNAAAIAEWQLGAGRGSRNLVMVTLGTGCGGGLILDGRPFRGAVGAAAELGHMVIVHDGRPCQGNCTGRGHLEPYVTGLALAAAARERLGPDVDAHGVIDLAESGDDAARELLAEVGRHLGSALGSFVNIFNPEVIVVGGGLGAAAGEHLLGPARQVLTREALSPGRERVRVVSAELGALAGLVGAALLAFEKLEAAPAV